MDSRRKMFYFKNAPPQMDRFLPPGASDVKTDEQQVL
jgi:hypothetical protein